jgi:hypothetical protein
MDTNQEPLDQNIQSPAQAEYQEMVQDDLTARLRSVASWFYWVVGLSAVNSIVVMTGAEWAFSLGLGITQVVDGVALSFQEVSDARVSGLAPGQVVAWLVDLLILGFFVFLGIMLTKRRAAWALWVGVVLYALDTLFFLIGPQVVPLIFHAFVIYKLTRGFGILKEFRQTNLPATGV